MNVDFSLKRSLELADKRDNACKSMKPCPECGTEQVQLTSWIDSIQWKCRHCKFEWGDTKND